MRLALPPGWICAQLDFREVGGHFETNALILDVTGRMHTWSPPPAVGERFSELREAMRRPSVWYRARFEVQYSGEEKFRSFGPDEPGMGHPSGTGGLSRRAAVQADHSTPCQIG